jgi:hypothetical protein
MTSECGTSSAASHPQPRPQPQPVYALAATEAHNSSTLHLTQQHTRTSRSSSAAAATEPGLPGWMGCQRQPCKGERGGRDWVQTGSQKILPSIPGPLNTYRATYHHTSRTPPPVHLAPLTLDPSPTHTTHTSMYPQSIPQPPAAWHISRHSHPQQPHRGTPQSHPTPLSLTHTFAGTYL